MRIAACLFLTSTLAFSQVTLTVPSANNPSIQSAVNAANAGDVVEVAPGTYFETIDFLGKAITVRSMSGAAQTVIDAGGIDSVVFFGTAETAASVLEGFTLTNGMGRGVTRRGGGVTILNSSPTIRECIIVGNTGETNTAGGIHITDGTPEIADCIVEFNFGGSASVSKQFQRGGAGGIHVRMFFPSTPGPVIKRCVIRNNVGGFGQGFIFSTGIGAAGGIDGENFTGSGAFLQLENTEITENVGGDGFNGLSPPIPARGGAGAIQLSGLRLLATHCTIADNIGGAGPVMGVGGVRLDGALFGPTPSLIANSILWNNVDVLATRAEIMDATGNLFVFRNIVDGGFLGGVSVTDIDPLFIDATNDDYRLSAASFGIDAGTCNRLPLGTTDLLGEPRGRGFAPDLGAHESSGALMDLALVGTCEDFILGSLVNGSGDAADQSKDAFMGDVVAIELDSPAASFIGSVAILAASAFPSGTNPAGPPILDELDLGANASALLTTTLPIGGLIASRAIPAGLAGISIRFQAIAVSNSAENGLYAVTNAHDITLL